MNKKFKTILASVALATAFSVTAETQVSAATKTAVTKTSAKTKLKKTKYQPYADPADMRKMTGTYWKKSSQTKTKYPNLRKVKNLNLRVSILGNRVYVRSGNKVLYTMYCSAGKMVNGKSLTPRGTYRTNSYHPHRFSSAFYPVAGLANCICSTPCQRMNGQIPLFLRKLTSWVKSPQVMAAFVYQ